VFRQSIRQREKEKKKKKREKKGKRGGLFHILLQSSLVFDFAERKGLRGEKKKGRELLSFIPAACDVVA